MVLAVVIVDRVLGKVLSNTSTRMQNKRHINLPSMIDDLKLVKVRLFCTIDERRMKSRS